MTEAQAKEVFAYIKHLQAISPVWNAATWNCVAFIQTIAMHMGLRVPGNHLAKVPEDWVNQLRKLNGGRRYMPGSEPMAQAPAVRRRGPRLRRTGSRRRRARGRQTPLRGLDRKPGPTVPGSTGRKD